MKRRQQIEEEVERTLRLLGEVQRVEGNPYLYTRLRSRLAEAAPAADRRYSPWARVLVYGFFGLLVAMNIFVIASRFGAAASEVTVTDVLTEEYGLSTAAVDEWDYLSTQ